MISKVEMGGTEPCFTLSQTVHAESNLQQLFSLTHQSADN